MSGSGPQSLSTCIHREYSSVSVFLRKRPIQVRVANDMIYTSGWALIIACRLDLCGSSVYVQKKWSYGSGGGALTDDSASLAASPLAADTRRCGVEAVVTTDGIAMDDTGVPVSMLSREYERTTMPPGLPRGLRIVARERQAGHGWRRAKGAMRAERGLGDGSFHVGLRLDAGSGTRQGQIPYIYRQVCSSFKISLLVISIFRSM